MSNIVTVLGSRGQIGQYLVPFLTQHGYQVLEFDIVNGPEQDLRFDSKNLFEAIAKSECVFFLAFDVGGSRYLENYQHSYDFISNNIRIMLNVFELLKVTKTKFIFASSQMSQMTFSTYGLLKLIGERWTESLSFGRVVKFWNVYGYEKDKEKYHVISDFLEMAMTSREIRMRTNGLESRDFLYGEDCAEALSIVMSRFEEIPTNMPLHIASHEFISILELAEAIAKEYGALIIPGDRNDPVQKMSLHRPDPFFLKYWNPKTSLQKGIRLVAQQMEKSVG